MRNIFIADKLLSIVVNRFKREFPKRELTRPELEKLWAIIYDKLRQGQSEEAVKKWCETTPFRKQPNE